MYLYVCHAGTDLFFFQIKLNTWTLFAHSPTIHDFYLLTKGHFNFSAQHDRCCIFKMKNTNLCIQKIKTILTFLNFYI